MWAVVRRTKILATLGPASASEAVLRALLAAGLDGVRLNFSYGTPAEHARLARLVRRLSQELGRPVAIVQDLQGVKARLGALDRPRLLQRGEAVVLSWDRGEGLPVEHPGLQLAVRPGERLLLGDGEVELMVEEAQAGGARARVIRGGWVRTGLGVHLPSGVVTSGRVTAKDEADLRLGLELGVDYVAMSFVRRATDLKALKARLGGADRPPVIAKLERREALAHLEEVLAAAEGVMVARGDLGLEVSLEEVPLAQKRILRLANRRGVLAITATQMLESMVEREQPTRAEVSDVANAILDGSDALMLSAETAVGRYPVDAVRTIAAIALRVDPQVRAEHGELPRPSRRRALARSACHLAQDVAAKAIVVFTRGGRMAQLVSKERPPVPVFAITPRESTWRRLALWWGVVPLLAPRPATLRQMVGAMEQLLVERGFLRRGDLVVLVRWAPEVRGWENSLSLHRLGRR